MQIVCRRVKPRVPSAHPRPCVERIAWPNWFGDSRTCTGRTRVWTAKTWSPGFSAVTRRRLRALRHPPVPISTEKFPRDRTVQCVVTGADARRLTRPHFARRGGSSSTFVQEAHRLPGDRGFVFMDLLWPSRCDKRARQRRARARAPADRNSIKVVPLRQVNDVHSSLASTLARLMRNNCSAPSIARTTPTCIERRRQVVSTVVAAPAPCRAARNFELASDHCAGISLAVAADHYTG